jgi:hypothetical protein
MLWLWLDNMTISILKTLFLCENVCLIIFDLQEMFATLFLLRQVYTNLTYWKIGIFEIGTFFVSVNEFFAQQFILK